MSSGFYDSHNHLHDPRIVGCAGSLSSSGVVRVVVNGTCEIDWPVVAGMADANPLVFPSLGLHPWFVSEASAQWKDRLVRFLDACGCGIGEIGLDRARQGIADPAAQEEAFIWQLGQAANRNLPVSIHCVKAWGRMLEILDGRAMPECGFLLHSYGGSPEMVDDFARLGGRFSFSGSVLHESNARAREAIRRAPGDRLLLETDAPNLPPPPAWVERTLEDPATSQPLNHPANLSGIYRGVAELLGAPVEELAARVGKNFLGLFGG